MAKLTPYFGTHAGDLKIYVGPFSVGQGAFDTFSDFHATFDGSYEFFGQSGDVAIDLTLSDHDVGSESGACTIKLNGKADTAATYQVSGSKLTITTKLNELPIEIHSRQGGTQVDNVSGHNIWIG
jgi:hypothetical protein